MKLAVLLFVMMIVAQPASAQSSVEARTRSIVASFNKSKHVVKSRHGITVEKYKRVESQPALRSDASAYSGSYFVEGLGYSLDLRIARDGTVGGSGEEPLATDQNIATQFSLSGKVAGALLTATKIYANGAREKLEGVFINSTSHDSPSDRGTTMFGLGVVTGLRDIGGVTTDRLFFQRK